MLELHQQASSVHKLAPSVNRMNTVLLAYCRTGQLQKAEHLIRDMRENMGLVPDVVCYTTLIDGYAKQDNLDRCWEIYHECMQKD